MATSWEYPPRLQLGALSYQQLPAGNVSSSTLPGKAHPVNASVLPAPEPSGVSTPLPPALGAPRAAALALLAVVSMPMGCKCLAEPPPLPVLWHWPLCTGWGWG